MIRIQGLQCRDVANLRDLKLEFQEGMNLVLGENEAGKSTLIKSILATLFGVENQSLRPVGFSGNYGAAVKIKSGEKEYIFDRSFADNHVKVSVIEDDIPKKIFDAKVSSKGRSADFTTYLGLLKEVLGLADRDVFEASALLLQHQLSLGKSATAKKIKQILSGQSTHDYDSVIANLTAGYFEITVKNPDGRNKSKPRLLEIAMNKKDDLVNRKEQAGHAYKEVLELQNHIEADSARIEKWQKKVKEINRILTVGTDYIAFDRKLKEHAAKHKDFTKKRRKITDLKTDLEKLAPQITELGVGGKLDKETEEKIRTRILLEQEIEDQKVKTEDALIVCEDFRNRANIPLLISIIGGTLTFAGAIAASFLIGLMGAPFFLIPLMIAFNGFWFWKKRKEETERRNVIYEQEKEKGEKLALESERINLSKEVESLGVKAFPGLLVQKEKGRKLIREKERYEDQLEVLTNISDIDLALSNLAREIGVLDQKRKDLAKIHPDLEKYKQEDLAKKKAERDDIEVKIAQGKVGVQKAREELAALIAVSENPESLDERIVDIDSQMEFLREKRDAISLAKEGVLLAMDEFRGEYLVGFAKEVGEIFSSLVDDNERKVSFDDDLIPALTTGQGALPIENLSAGTRDQLYLAARITLAQKMADNKALPLIFDDPFVTFDKKRKKKALKVLEKISRKHQVLLFSHDKSLKDIPAEKANAILLEKYI